MILTVAYPSCFLRRIGSRQVPHAHPRPAALPLVYGNTGDCPILFGQWGLLPDALKIGQFVRTLGWLGLCATLAWLAYRTYRASLPTLRPLELSKYPNGN